MEYLYEKRQVEFNNILYYYKVDLKTEEIIEVQLPEDEYLFYRKDNASIDRIKYYIDFEEAMNKL